MGHGEDRHLPWVHGPRGRHGSRVVDLGGGRAGELLVAGVLAGYVAFREVFGKIHEVNVSDLGKRPPKYDNSLNILVIGSDTRKGKNASSARTSAVSGRTPSWCCTCRPGSSTRSCSASRATRSCRC